jgi:hypothetical protein
MPYVLAAGSASPQKLRGSSADLLRRRCSAPPNVARRYHLISFNFCIDRTRRKALTTPYLARSEIAYARLARFCSTFRQACIAGSDLG